MSDLTHIRRRRRGRRLVKNVFILLGISLLLSSSQCVQLSVLKLAPVEYATNAFSSKSVEIRKIAVVVRALQTTQNLVISRCCFAEDGKEMHQELPIPVHSYCFALQIYFWWRSRNSCRRVLRKVPIDFQDLFVL